LLISREAAEIFNYNMAERGEGKVEDKEYDPSRSMDLPGDYNIPMHHPAFRSAYEGQSRNVMAALDRDPNLISAIGHLDLPDIVYVPSTLLHFACRGGNDQLAFELVKRGGNVSQKNQVGDTCLTYCSESLKKRLLELADSVDRK